MLVMNVYPKEKHIEGQKLKPFLIYILLLTLRTLRTLLVRNVDRNIFRSLYGSIYG